MQTIAIATDFSETSAHAARYAASLSSQLGAKRLILYHSFDDTPISTEVPVPEKSAEDLELARESSLLGLEVIAAQIRPLLAVHTRADQVANDLPLFLGIERLVEEQDVDLVLAGMTGKTGIANFFVGSNTIGLAETCPAPLLIVPHEANFEPIKSAIFACDLKKVDKTTPVSFLTELVTKLGVTLHVLNVERPNTRFDPDMIPEQFKLHGLLDNLGPEYHYIEHPDVAEGIMEFTESQKAGLVITLPRKYGFFQSLFHRSVTKRLAHHTRVPLLVLRSENDME